MPDLTHIGQLKPDPLNARQHNPRNVGLIVDALHEVGAARSIVVDEDGVILAGNATVEAAAEAGIERVQVVDADGSTIVAVRRSGLSPEAKRRLALYDNRAAELADWDSEILAAFAMEDTAVFDGLFDGDELAELVAGFGNAPHHDDPGAQTDRADELCEKWGVELGQTWTFNIGDAGDSTLYVGPAESAHIACDFAVYDPPFDWTARQQDNALSWASWRKALLMGLHYCMPLVERQDFLHWWVWDSGMARFGGKGYKPMSGCAMMLAFGEKAMWHEDEAIAVLNAYGVDHYGVSTQVLKVQDHLAGRVGYDKPPVLFDYIVALYSTTGDVVGDPFAGSGGIAAACVRLVRQYRGAEIEPTHAALTLQRLSDMDVEPRLADRA